MQRSGGCLCGAVKYVANNLKAKIQACHCGMCRRWTGGPYLSFSSTAVSWNGEDRITKYPSSEWAERGFCSVCGTSLYYLVTAPGPYKGHMHIAFGTLDDQADFAMTMEYFIDLKPDAYSLEGEHPKMTEAAVLAAFGSSDD